MSDQSHPPFALADDGVDPRLVPQRTLYTGARMPAIGFGTFGSDHALPSEVAEAVRGAARGLGVLRGPVRAVSGDEFVGRACLSALRQRIEEKSPWQRIQQAGGHF